MAPKSFQESEEEQVPLAPAGGEPTSHDLGSPVGTPKDAKPQCTPVWQGHWNCRLAPESLDPRTLRLLWEQRELEIQALRWAIQNGQNARQCHILQEVAGIPPERSSCSQDKFLQNQVQKLTLELKAQKEQAQLVRGGIRELGWALAGTQGLVLGGGVEGGSSLAGSSEQEKEQLENRLTQTLHTLQQLEAELQTFQKSCLLQLACSSWVDHIVRSQTGSVEVVTAETLMDPSDLSDNDQAPSAGEGFRLEDVDWNSIAHWYPSLFTSINFNSQQKGLQSHPSPPLDTWDSDSPGKHRKKPGKRLQWRSLPWVATSSSGYAGSDSSSCQLVLHSQVQKVTEYPPQVTGLTSAEQIQTCSRSFSKDTEGRVGQDSLLPFCNPIFRSFSPLESNIRTGTAPLPRTLHLLQGWPALQGTSPLDPPCGASIPKELLSLDLQKIHKHPPSKTALEPQTDPGQRYPGHQLSCCLKIAAVNRREKFIRILNQSSEQTVDLGGFVLQQVVRSFPVCMYRFPPSTLLPPGHHITVWGEGTSSTKKQRRPVSLRQDPFHIHFSQGCVTLLLNPEGQVLSEYQSPHRVTPASKTYADNTDWSIDRFPLSETRPGANAKEQPRQPQPPRKGRAREARAGRRKWGGHYKFLDLAPAKPVPHTLARTAPTFLSPTSSGTTALPSTPQHQAGSRPELFKMPLSPSTFPGAVPARNTSRRRAVALMTPHPVRTRGILQRQSTRKPFHPGEVPAQPEGAKTEKPQLLPAIPEAGLCLEDCPARRECKVRVCRKTVDRSCPMVALSVQNTAESRFGFRFLSCPPITVDVSRRA
ncbi:LOW QUALITY PROTEIN: lamin tail domain-containing protein 2 [Castor canadensis]|uniref:LOW QUALITY PROTEIN: lamin tail domain-containing protein 2 n=1 Tax=Castor canadensis TaxID=51338 RepID=A0AC58KT53_CASCN